ncbi:MAG TPA: hypothetical protein VKU94_03765 [Geobacterales bacterium]|nr:hypothetical protein [Geobacterales bacterium]
MHIEKRSDISARKVKLEEQELEPLLEKYLKRIELAKERGGFKKLIVPLGKLNIEELEKYAKDKLGVELECVPVNSAENMFAITIKKINSSKS